MTLLPDGFTFAQWGTVHGALSLGIAGMVAITAFLWLQLPNVAKHQRMALTLASIASLVAAYTYVRLFNSWCAAFTVSQPEDEGRYVTETSGVPFNDTFRVLDWLITTPLLLVSLVLVMRLPERDQTATSWRLASAAALMIILGMISPMQSTMWLRWVWWVIALVPLLYIVAELTVGLKGHMARQPESLSRLLTAIRYLTVAAWVLYPIVAVIRVVGRATPTWLTWEQVGFTAADVFAKGVFGVLLWAAASERSKVEEEGRLLA